MRAALFPMSAALRVQLASVARSTTLAVSVVRHPVLVVLSSIPAALALLEMRQAARFPTLVAQVKVLLLVAHHPWSVALVAQLVLVVPLLLPVGLVARPLVLAVLLRLPLVLARLVMRLVAQPA